MQVYLQLPRHNRIEASSVSRSMIESFRILETTILPEEGGDNEPKRNWEVLEKFIYRHPEIKAYFHGDKNYNEFYSWTGAEDYFLCSMTQSAGSSILASIVTDPIESATMCPEVGFFMFVIEPLISALRVEYSKALSHEWSKVQFSRTRSRAWQRGCSPEIWQFTRRRLRECHPR